MYCEIPVLERCCFCLPLRKGILTFGYINIVFCTIMVGLYSYCVHRNCWMMTMYHGTGDAVPKEAVIGLYCCEIVFTILLIYGGHKDLVRPVQMYYYYSISTLVAGLVLQVVDFASYNSPYYYVAFTVELFPILICSTILQVYLLLMIRSMILRLNRGRGPQTFENQLEQIVYGAKESNGAADINASCAVEEAS